MRSQLYDLVLENSVADLMTRNFAVTINRRNFFVLDVELDLDVTAVNLLRHGCVLRASNYLKRIAHVWRDEEGVREDLQQGEHLNADHLGHDLIASIPVGVAAHVCRRRHGCWRVVAAGASEGQCEGGKLVNARLTAVCSEVALLLSDLRGLESARSVQAH